MKKMLKVVCIGAVMAILVTLVTSANGQLLSRYEFEGNWANSQHAKSTLAVTPYGGAALGTSTRGGLTLNDANIQSSTSWLGVGYEAFADISTKMTISTWVKYASTSTSMQRIMGKAYDWYIDANTDAGAHQQYAQFVIRDSANYNTVISLQGDTSIGDGLWHHVAATWDTETGVQSLYIDGILDATQNTGVKTGIANTNARYAIGARQSAATTGTSIYRGRVDDVRVYNTQEQIEDWFVMSPPEPAEPTTIALLSFGSMLVFRRRFSKGNNK